MTDPKLISRLSGLFCRFVLGVLDVEIDLEESDFGEIGETEASITVSVEPTYIQRFTWDFSNGLVEQKTNNSRI